MIAPHEASSIGDFFNGDFFRAFLLFLGGYFGTKHGTQSGNGNGHGNGTNGVKP